MELGYFFIFLGGGGGETHILDDLYVINVL